jgi:hypothetical protein
MPGPNASRNDSPDLLVFAFIGIVVVFPGLRLRSGPELCHYGAFQVQSVATTTTSNE